MSHLPSDHDEGRRAAGANAARYGVDDTGEYQQEPYHRIRIELATAMLFRLLDRGPSRSLSRRILDIGPGTELTPQMLRDRGSDVFVGDISEPVAKSTAAVARSLVMDGSQTFPFADHSIEGILAGEVIEHLYDPVAFLGECRRVLVQGGVLVLTTPNLAGLQDRLRFLWGRSPRHVDPLHSYLRLHIRPFTLSLLKATLAHAGFADIEVASNHLVVRLGGYRADFRKPAEWWPSLGGTLIVGSVAH